MCRAIAEFGISIRSAHLSTYGPEARDVFYVVDGGGNPLDSETAENVRLALKTALTSG